MAILTPDVLGQVSSLTNYNGNLVTIEASLLDIGPFVVSGLVPSAGTGLSVNVTAGTASIGGRVTKSTTWTIGSLTASLTNHLYLLNTGSGTANTTGTAPANSVKLGTAVCGVATVSSVDTSPTSGRQDKNAPSVTGNGTFVKTPDATANYGVLSVGDGGFGGLAGDYVGSTGGTLIAVNYQSGGTADLLNLQIDGVSKWKVGSGGNVTLGDGTNFVLNTSTGTKIGTGTTQKLGFYNATPIVQPAANTDIRTTLLNLGLLAGGVNPLNLNGGDLTANAAILSGALQGSGTALQLKRLAYTFPADANQTLSASDKANVILDIQTGVLSTQRDLLVSGNAGAFYIIINREAFAVNVRVGASTGIVVGSHKSRILCFPGGTTCFALTADVDYTV